MIQTFVCVQEGGYQQHKLFDITMSVPFEVKVSPDEVEDLRHRLKHARWPDQLEDLRTEWDNGTSLPYLKQLVDFFLNEYNWSEQEQLLNSFKQYTMKVNQIDMHFVHEVNSDAHSPALLLLHGWPGSFFEFHKVIKPSCPSWISCCCSVASWIWVLVCSEAYWFQSGNDG
jgi:hypothetical protein